MLRSGEEVYLCGSRPHRLAEIGPFIVTAVPARPDGAIPHEVMCSRCRMFCMALACAQDEGKPRGSSLWVCFFCDRMIYQEACRVG